LRFQLSPGDLLASEVSESLGLAARQREALSVMIDFPLDMDDIVKAIAVALLLAHIGALAWSGWLRKGIAPVLALNLLVSGSVAIYWGLHIAELGNYIEAVWTFVAFEFVVLVTSLLAVFRLRVPQAAIWIEFVAHALMTAAAVLFILTFRITRLI
jgi:hypothetical protein